MKKIIFSTLFVFHFLFCIGATFESVQDGTWQDNSTWNTGWDETAPNTSNTIVINSGNTVTVTGNYGIYEDMIVEVYGTLAFDNGAKLNFDADSKIFVYSGGTVTSNKNNGSGEKINIGGTEIWNGKKDGDGPKTMDKDSISNEILPVDLLSFNAEKKSGYVQVRWSTSKEINNDYFTIERSYNANDWHEIAKKKGAGNSQNVNYYQIKDYNITSGIHYYRLKQTDFDGKISYSRIIKVNISYVNNNNLTVYPIPANSYFYIEGGDLKNSNIFMINNNGVKLNVNSQWNNGKLKVDTKSIKSGIYTFLITNNYNKNLYKRIKVK